MQTTILKLTLSAIFTFIAALSSGQMLHVATYNIRFDNPRDSLDLWKDRHPYVAGIIKLYDIDIFGTQEGLKHQLEDLKNNLQGYEYTGVGRDDGGEKGEHTAIFYNSAVFKLLDSGNFWLSKETGRPNKGWDAALPRICTWGKFRILSSGKEFYFFNTHFDHIGEKARTESAKLVIAKIREIAKTSPAIFTGDLNFDETNSNFVILKTSGFLSDTYDMAEFRYAPGGTFTAFDITAKPKGRIDHIFITDHFKVKKYALLTNTYNGRFPSDHFAVMTEIVLE